jgi:hypothetical protein
VGVSGQPGQDVFAGEEQRVEVRLGASGGEDSVTAGEPEVAAGPVDEAPLHEGRDLGLVVGVDRGVDGREHRFGGDGGHSDRAVEVGDVAGVMEPHGVVGIERVGFAQRLGVADSGRVEVDGVDGGLQPRSIFRRGGPGRGAESFAECVDDTVHESRVLVCTVGAEQGVGAGIVGGMKGCCGGCRFGLGEQRSRHCEVSSFDERTADRGSH